MDYITIFKTLANDTRLQILRWLKEPEVHFRPQAHMSKGSEFPGGVCVGDIQEKAGLSQSTTSQYLSMLQRAGLLEAKRIGQWTYYRRNEEAFQQLSHYFREEL
ncbi:ArsR/SmtB family transcription factor [Bacillus songklensis]|uniref:ArsR/SmtB family transcription factor n=1 Tax=Bacillus songklensis TaxID=1069116 RepID=A0ABV8B3B9_9BACI